MWQELHLKPFWGPAPQTEIDLSMVCVQSKNHQHLFENYYDHLEGNCLRNSETALSFSRPSSS